jgi:hypothetical protein
MRSAHGDFRVADTVTGLDNQQARSEAQDSIALRGNVLAITRRETPCAALEFRVDDRVCVPDDSRSISTAVWPFMSEIRTTAARRIRARSALTGIPGNDAGGK